MPGIEFNHVSKRYDTALALDDVSFKITHGEIFSIIGPNGAGKSTILKIICGLLRQTSGTIRIEGHATEGNDLRRIIGYMPEESALYESMRVSDYLYFFAELYNINRKAAAPKIRKLLEFLSLEDKPISDLSKGMRRKVLLARSLINDPKILVYDEPASGLDPGIAQSLLDRIVSLKKSGTTIVMSAHDLSQIEEVSDTVLMLRKGAVDLCGSVAAIKKKYGSKEYHVTYREQGKIHSMTTAKKEEMLGFMKEHTVLDLTTREKSLHEIFIDKYG
jgi:ABC-2 type transport system ATP-binding protein